MRKSQEYYSIDNNKELFTLLKERMVLKSYWNISDGVSRLIDGRGEFSKSIDRNNENINKIINYTFTCYYWSLINEYDIKNNKIDFESYVDIGRYIKNPLDVYPVLFAPPFDDISTSNLNLISKLGMLLIHGQSYYRRFFRSPYIPRFF